MGKGCIIFGGITIGNNVTIGANAVVNKSVPDNAVVAGVPAKILRIKWNYKEYEIFALIEIGIFAFATSSYAI